MLTAPAQSGRLGTSQKQTKETMNQQTWQQTWQLIMASSEPVPMPAVNASGRDTTRQLRAALWQAGHIVLSQAEVIELLDV